MLKNRISGTIDFYSRTTSDLLYWYEVSVPPYLVSELFTNVGTLGNQGVEIMLSGLPVVTKDFRWSSSVTFARNVNKVVKFTNSEFHNAGSEVGWLNTPMGAYAQRIIEGESLGSFYAPIWKGIDQSGNDQLKNSWGGSVDKSRWSNVGSAYPDFTLGWSNTLVYKRVDLNIMMRASIGGKVFNRYRGDYENLTGIGLKNILASWLDNTAFTGDPRYSSKYIEDATYLKIDNVSLGYNFDFAQAMLKRARLYVAAQNILCLTKYTGVDPEVALTGLAPGIESTSYYPRTAVFTVGVNLTF
jgi:hypothetical protein